MRKLFLFLGILLLSTSMFAQGDYQARQPNVMVVPNIPVPFNVGEDEMAEAEAKLLAEAMGDEAVILALSKIREEFSLRKFPTIDFEEEYRRVRNRAYSGAKLNAKSTGLQEQVSSSRADICVYVDVKEETTDSGASRVTIIMNAKDKETAFSYAEASLLSRPFRTSKVALTQYALESISENFFNQLNLSFRDMVLKGREVNIVVRVGENSEFDMDSDVVGTEDMYMEEVVSDWVAENAFKGNGEVRAAGSEMNIFMRVPVYHPDTGKPFPITRIGTDFLRYLNTQLSPAGYKAIRKASKGALTEIIIE